MRTKNKCPKGYVMNTRTGNCVQSVSSRRGATSLPGQQWFGKNIDPDPQPMFSDCQAAYEHHIMCSGQNGMSSYPVSNIAGCVCSSHIYSTGQGYANQWVPGGCEGQGNQIIVGGQAGCWETFATTNPTGQIWIYHCHSPINIVQACNPPSWGGGSGGSGASGGHSGGAATGKGWATGGRKGGHINKIRRRR